GRASGSPLRLRTTSAATILAVLAVLVAILFAPTRADAHPLGNFTVNRYSRLEPAGDRLRVRYVPDMAAIPTFQERASVDRDRDGRVSEAENRAYAERKAAELVASLHLAVDGASVALRVTESTLTFPAGQGGLSTLRLALWLEARVPVGGAYKVDYR